MKVLLPLLALLIAFCASEAPTLCKPIEDYFQLAEKVDKAYELRISMGIIESYGHPYRRDLVVSKPLILSERKRLRSAITKNIKVEGEAEQNLFEDEELFNGIEFVVLGCPRNDEHLKLLAENYPDVRYLSVVQKVPLSADAMRAICKMKHLQLLQLVCPVEPSCDEPVQDLPESLIRLCIQGSANIRKMPNLRHLGIKNCKIGPDFLPRLDAPCLECLRLDRVDITPNSLSRLAQFKALRWFYSSESHIDDCEIENFKGNYYLGVDVRRDWKRVHDFYRRAEESATRSAWSEAIVLYDASVFSHSTARGYVQRARCLLELHRYAEAIQSCNYALEKDPSYTDAIMIKLNSIFRQLLQPCR